MSTLPDVETAAQQLVEQRMHTVRKLIAAQQRVDDLHNKLTEAQSNVQAAWKKTLAGGWSETELKKIGLSSPGKAPRKRAPKSPVRNKQRENPTDQTSQEPTTHLQTA